MMIVIVLFFCFLCGMGLGLLSGLLVLLACNLKGRPVLGLIGFISSIIAGGVIGFYSLLILDILFRYLYRTK